MSEIKQAIEFFKSIDLNKITLEELEQQLPYLGMNNECLDQMPEHFSEFYGKGIKFWQYPNQLAKLLKFINNIKINSYLEIGCRWGGTFIIINETFKKLNPNIKSWACDLENKSYILEQYSSFDNFNYIKINSHNPELLNILPKTIDFIFIDGDHSYDGVKQDYENALTLNPKYIMFHDISCKDMGVYMFWKEIKNNYKYHEFIDQYKLKTINHDMFGIGIIETR